MGKLTYQTNRVTFDSVIGVEADWMLHSEQPWNHLVSVTPQDLATHALIIGATGSGKTVLLHHLIAQDLERGHSVCVLDLRGDLVSAVVEMCAAGVDPKLLRIIDLREKSRPFGFDPLHGRGEPYFRALSVLDVVAKESESWGVQLSETLRNALMLLAEAGAPITELEPLFYDRQLRQTLLESATTDTVISFWQRFDELSKDRQANLAMPVLNKVSLLLSTPTLRRILGHPKPFDLGAHLAVPGSVTLVSLAVDELHASARMMGSLVLSALCREMFSRVDVPESHRNPVRLYVDEFENFGTSDFESILAEGRRFKFSAVLAHQTLAQLTPRIRSMILGNVGVKFVFRCGREDSANLSKDLFGGPTQYDLTDLPVGYAVLWKRESGTVEVEVSEPLVRDVGLRSHAAQRFLEAVYDQAGSEGDFPARRSARNTPSADSQRRAVGTKHVSPQSLEDWLS